MCYGKAREFFIKEELKGQLNDSAGFQTKMSSGLSVVMFVIGALSLQ